jgi:membrane protein
MTSDTANSGGTARTGVRGHRDTGERAGGSTAPEAAGSRKLTDPAETSGDDRERGLLPPDHPSKPDSPSDLKKPTWFGITKRSFSEFSDDNCTDWAAALTYYGVLALFPAITVLVSLVGLFADGKATVDALMATLEDMGAGAAVGVLEKPVSDLVNAKQAAGLGLILGLAGALWSASGYIGAFTRASNAIYEVEEGRPFYKLRPQQLGVTLGALILVAIIAGGLIVSGPVAEWIGERLGIGQAAVTVFQFGKWPVLLLIVTVLISTLYWFAPNVRQPKFRWFTVGGALALLVWIVSSAAFGFYVANFGSYNKTYGSLGAIVAFLVWLYISNCAILLGAEINAEMERGRELQAGQPAEENLLLPLRDETKLKKKKAKDND